MKQSLLFISLSLLSLLCSSTTFAQSPASAPAIPAAKPPALAQPPATPAAPPVDILGVLKQANGYNVFIRLLKTTQLINQINSQLATTKSGGITILAPDDGAFSELKPGFLNTLSDGQKLELLQFHILPDYISTSNFDTLSNPVRTLASANPKRTQLNVTSFNGNVNISTGIVNTTINGVIYTDTHLNMYKVGKVLLPQDFFSVAKTPSPAPAPAKAKAKAKAAADSVGDDSAAAKAPKAAKPKPLPSAAASDPSQSSSQVVPTQVNSAARGIVGIGAWGILGGFVMMMKMMV